MKKKQQNKYSFLLFGLIFWGAGFMFFWWLNSSEIDLEKKLAAIERGKGKALVLTVDKKWVQPASGSGPNRGTDTHWISFAPIRESAEDIDRAPAYDEWTSIRVGQQFAAHWVNNDVVIEEMDVLQPKAKWVMLGFCVMLGMVPMSMTGYQILRSEA